MNGIRINCKYVDECRDYGELCEKCKSIENLIYSYINYDNGKIMGYTSNINNLEHFLKSDNVIINQNLYCREKVFITAFNDHCRESNLGAIKWTNQFYAGIFHDFGITIQRNCRKRYPNIIGQEYYTGTWIMGVDIKHLNDDE